jgi:hypothetical protein
MWGLGRLVEAQLFGVHAIDAPTLGVASPRAGWRRAGGGDGAERGARHR